MISFFTLVLLTVLYSSITSKFFPKRQVKWLAPRNAAIPWCLFQSIAHSLFLVRDITEMFSNQVPAHCLQLISSLFYFLAYAIVLHWTISADSKYWSQKNSYFVFSDSVNRLFKGESYGSFVPKLLPRPHYSKQDYAANYDGVSGDDVLQG